MGEKTGKRIIDTPPPQGREVGQPQLTLSSSFVSERAEEDLRLPNLFYTCDQMELDPAVSQPYQLTRALETIALSQGKFEPTKSRKSKALADFGNYLLHNIRNSSTWFNLCADITTSIKYGFSLHEMMMIKEHSGPYKGMYVFDAISHRPVKSVHAWVWDKYQRRVTHVVQDRFRVTSELRRQTPSQYRGSLLGQKPLQQFAKSTKYPVIPINKLFHCRYNPIGADPQGNSGFLPAYTPWQEKTILAKYQVIGVTRDLGGTGVIRLDREFLQKALDPDGKFPSEKKAYEEIVHNMENMTAGKQSFFILSSDVIDGTSMYSNDLKLIGVEGGGKQFDTNKIIEQKVNEIHNAFGTGFLGLGQNGQTGAYNLATAGMTTHHFLIERDLLNFCNTIRKQILQRALDVNGIDYKWSDLPTYSYREPDQLSTDELGKLVQRMKSVGALTEGILAHFLKKSGCPIEDIEDIDFTGKGESRAGESFGTSGTGATQAAGINSTVNTENKQLKIPHNYVAEKEGEDIVLIDTQTGEIVEEIAD